MGGSNNEITLSSLHNVKLHFVNENGQVINKKNKLLMKKMDPANKLKL